MINEISLFSGICGFSLAGKMVHGKQWRTIAYVEWENYCQKVIKQRITDSLLDAAPIFGDIRQFNRDYAREFAELAPRPLIITGGFPCQPFSVAGKQQGEKDKRNIWPATIECIRIIRPEYVLLENVPGLLGFGYVKRIFGDLAEEFSHIEGHCLSAAQVGANHKRERLWIVADSNEL